MATSDGFVERNPIPKEAEEPTTATLLEATSVNCHLLAEKLRKQESQGNVNAINSYLGNNLPNPSKDEKSKYFALLADYIQLKSDKQNVEDYNKRLLTYKAQKDEYTDKLMREVKMKSRPTSSDQSPNASSDNVTISKEKYEKMYEEMKAKYRENALLKKEVDKSKMEHKEETEVLKMQVRAHRDDWEAERREKVEVENRELQLQEKVHAMERKIQQLQQQLLENDNCKCQCHSNFSTGSQSEPIIRNHQSGLSSSSYYGSSGRLIPRSSYYNLSNSDIVSDSGAQGGSKSSSSPKQSIMTAPTINHNKNNDIHCPECGKVFPEHVHLHFLEHFERCHRRTLL